MNQNRDNSLTLGTEINPYDKMDEIRQAFAEYEIIEHTKAEDGFEYLHPLDRNFEIVNPFQDENLWIEVSYEFILSFGSWHTHYCSYEYEFDAMLRDAFAFIEGRLCTIHVVSKEREYISSLTDQINCEGPDIRALIERLRIPEEFLVKMRQDGAALCANYWNPKYDRQFCLSADLLQ